METPQPAYLTAPEGSTSAYAEAIELVQACELHLDPWQQVALRAAMATQPDGRWAAMEFGLVVPRQNGKGSVMEAKVLHSLFRSPARLLLWSAHEFKTASEAFLRIKDAITHNDDLLDLVERFRTGHGDEAIELRDGTRLRFVARSRGSGRGFSGDELFLDEAYALTMQQVAAILPTLSARPNPQVWYASSAPLEDSEVLRKVMRRGRSGEPGLGYVEYSAPDDAHSADVAARHAANPSPRIGQDFLDAEYRAMGDSPEYRRERLGIVDLSTVLNPAIDSKAWLAGKQVASMDDLRDRVACVIEVGMDGQSVSLVAAARDGEKVRVEPVADWPTVAAARAELQDLLGRVRPVKLGWYPDGPGATLMASLSALRGVTLAPLRAERPAIAMGFAEAVASGQLLHSDDPLLSAQVADAEKKYSGDRWTFQRQGSGQVHVLEAAAGAVHLARSTRARGSTRRGVLLPAA